jgi:hypothetical protein
MTVHPQASFIVSVKHAKGSISLNSFVTAQEAPYFPSESPSCSKTVAMAFFTNRVESFFQDKKQQVVLFSSTAIAV